MIGYTTIGSNQFEKALDYYDKLFAVIGGKRMMEYPTNVLYGFAKGAAFGVCKPHDKGAATNGNGAMIAFSVSTKENVHAVYDAALKLGGPDDGPPGDRGGNFYAAYFRDLDNNKLCAYAMIKD